jgi:ABC transporter DrrB family efflux protein
MTTVTQPRDHRRTTGTGIPLEKRGLAQQSLSVVWRNLLHIRRMPEMLMDVTIQPVMFVLLFAFVFGGSIAVAGSNYREFLLPGIMVQTIVFSSFVVAVGLNADLDKGIVDRMRSLPISRASVLVGRSISSLIHSSIGIVVMAVTGLMIGWGINTNVLEASFAFVLLIVFGFSMIWLGIWVGSALRSVEAVQGFMFTVMFPLTFVANTFAPTESMPPWLRTIAEWNPVSCLTQACRNLWGNGAPAPPDAAYPLHHPEIFVVLWAIVLTAVFAPMAVRAFRKRASD